MTKTIISIISTVSLLSVGSSALAEYRNYMGETLDQEVQRLNMERRIRQIEDQQQRIEDQQQQIQQQQMLRMPWH